MKDRARYSALPVFREAVVLGAAVAAPGFPQSEVSDALSWRDADPGRGAIAVCNAYRVADVADVLYAGEKCWFDRHAVDAARRFRGQVWTGSDAVVKEWPTVRLVRRAEGDRLPPDGICSGGPVGSSEIQAVYFAVLCGATRVGVLGLHAGNGGPERARDYWPLVVTRAASQLRERGVEVVDLSPSSAVVSFDRRTLADWLGGR